MFTFFCFSLSPATAGFTLADWQRRLQKRERKASVEKALPPALPARVEAFLQSTRHFDERPWRPLAVLHGELHQGHAWVMPPDSGEAAVAAAASAGDRGAARRRFLFSCLLTCVRVRSFVVFVVVS